MYIKTINNIVWWIPISNLRNNIRNKLINKVSKYYRQDKFLLNEIEDKNMQRNIFKANIKSINIEIHSYCNRKCWYCPNSFIDRHSNFIEMDEKIFLKILENLREIDYSNHIGLIRYNESLSNKELVLKRIKQIKEYIPNCILQIFTNGDYLTREYLKELKMAGINSMIISYHYDGKFDPNNIKPFMEKNINKWGLKIDKVIDNENLTQIVLKDDCIEYFVYNLWNFLEGGANRAGTIDKINEKLEEKTIQCYYPFDNIEIDYKGFMMACCHVRSEVDKHKSMILGDLNGKEDIFQIFTSKKYVNTRKYLSRNSVKKEPCNLCNWHPEKRKD